MKKFINKYSTFALLMLAVIAGAIVVWMLASKPAPAAPPLPSPNGYDDFLMAEQGMVRVLPGVDDGDLAGLAKVVEQNKEALRLVRLGLSRKCRVPVQFGEAYIPVHGGNLSSLRSLAIVLMAEGKLAERQGRYVDALATHSPKTRSIPPASSTAPTPPATCSTASAPTARTTAARGWPSRPAKASPQAIFSPNSNCGSHLAARFARTG